MVKNLVELLINLKLTGIKIPVRITPVAVKVAVIVATVGASHPVQVVAAAAKKKAAELKVFMRPFPLQMHHKVELRHSV